MTQVRYRPHVFSKSPAQVFEVEHLALWLGERASKGPRVTLQVFKGEPSQDTDISRDEAALLASNEPYYTVLESPGTGPEFIAAFQYIVAAYSIATAFMASKPKMPNNVNRSQESPNNALGNRENQVRLMQRIEDIYGTVKAIPSQIMQTYNKYKNSVKFEYGFYCVGHGYYDISAVKDGDTDLGSITGSSAAFYAPFVSPNNGGPFLQIGASIIDRLVSVRRASQVNGATLKAANQIQLEASSGYYLLQPGAARTIGATTAPASALDRVVQFYKRPNFNAVCTAGQTVTLAVPDRTIAKVGQVVVTGALRQYEDASTIDAVLFSDLRVGGNVTFSGFVDPANNGTFTVAAMPDPKTVIVSTGTQTDEIGGIGAIGVSTFQSGAAFSGTRTIAEVGDGYLILSTASFPYERNDPPAGGPNTNIVANNGLSDWTDWVTLPTTDRNEIWSNIVAPQGMYKDNGGISATSVAFAMEMQQLDGSLNPIGGVVTAGSSITGVTTDERAETLESATGWTGPARVRMRRTTPFDYFFQGTVADEIKWTDLYSVSPVSKAHFGDVTTVHTVTQATARSTSVQGRQLNCLATRKIPGWDGSNFTGGFDAEGRHTWGTLYPSTYLADVMAAITLDPKIGNRPGSDIDMAQWQAVASQLAAIHSDAGRFNYTFDSENMTFEETLQVVANACFSTAYRQGGKIRLALDRKQDTSAAIFTHRQKKPRSETIVRTFASESAYDGVEFVYQDPDTQQAETIRLPLDGSASSYKKFEIPGIRLFAQAWLRANREYRKLLGQRQTIETACTTDARLLLPFRRIDVTDNTRFKSYDGEVIGQDGLLLTLSQPVDFIVGLAHSIVLMRRDGSTQGRTVTQVAGRRDQVLLESLPTEAIKTQTNREGIATVYSFAADVKRDAQAWLVGTIDPPKDNYMVVRGVNYSPTYYEMDTQPIPPRDSVINL